MKKKKCEDCKHGDENFWGYDECWLYNKNLDFENTANTADREKTATKLNKYGNCIYFEKLSVFFHIRDWLDYYWWRFFR